MNNRQVLQCGYDTNNVFKKIQKRKSFKVILSNKDVHREGINLSLEKANHLEGNTGWALPINWVLRVSILIYIKTIISHLKKIPVDGRIFVIFQCLSDLCITHSSITVNVVYLLWKTLHTQKEIDEVVVLVSTPVHPTFWSQERYHRLFIL